MKTKKIEMLINVSDLHTGLIHHKGEEVELEAERAQQWIEKGYAQSKKVSTINDK